jgi:hypothetical protein
MILVFQTISPSLHEGLEGIVRSPNIMQQLKKLHLVKGGISKCKRKHNSILKISIIIQHRLWYFLVGPLFIIDRGVGTTVITINPQM